MKTELKLITPKIAETLLSNNGINRKLRHNIIDDYARQMASGLWKEETGESIKISINGDILDGQHRLMAIIKSNVSLLFLVVSELETEVFKVLDTGVTRTAGDIFHIAGIKQANNHAAIITRYLGLKQGRMAVLSYSTGRNNSDSIASGITIKSIKYSKSELLSVYMSRIKFWEAVVSMADHWYRQFQHILTFSDIGSLYAFFYDINEDDAFKFIDLLCSGVDLSNSDPIKLLREKLIFSKTNMKFKLTSIQKLGLIFKAWNHFRDKKQISVLRFHRESDNFPVPK